MDVARCRVDDQLPQPLRVFHANELVTADPGIPTVNVDQPPPPHA